MTDDQGSVPRNPMVWAAALTLCRLTDELGRSGRCALRSAPDLLAQVDQHAADVRDTLAGPDGILELPALAAYADGVRDVAMSRGIDPVRAVADGWADPPWASVRLLAVHVLAGNGTYC